MNAPTMTLPPIALADLPEKTKDFILALCNRDNITPAEAMKQTLDASAARAGFLPLPQDPQPEGDSRKAAMAA